MLEGADFEIELLGDSAEHEDFVLAVGMAVDEALAGEDLGEGFEFEIAGMIDFELFLMSIDSFDCMWLTQLSGLSSAI